MQCTLPDPADRVARCNRDTARIEAQAGADRDVDRRTKDGGSGEKEQDERARKMLHADSLATIPLPSWRRSSTSAQQSTTSTTSRTSATCTRTSSPTSSRDTAAAWETTSG